MKKIRLGGKWGLYAVVDDEDFERLSRHKWHSGTSGNVHGQLYATRRGIPSEDATTKVLMHRDILRDELPKYPPEYVADHIDGDSLDNRRENLRIVTQAENVANRHRFTKTSRPPRNVSEEEPSKYSGVFRTRKIYASPWYARIIYNKQEHYLGVFMDEKEAALAYDRKALELMGEQAMRRINFPEEAAREVA